MTLAAKIIQKSMRADALLGAKRRLFFGERPGLVVALFHNVFKNETDLRSGLANPLEEMTIERIKAFLAVWHNAGYRFVSVREVLDGLDPQGRYIMISFDDGYRSVLDILPDLEHYRAPAVVFATSANIETDTGFWPNTVYREEMAGHGSPITAFTLIENLKGKSVDEIQRFICDKYGNAALRPHGEIDRPLTKDELANLSHHPLIEIGNHTANHADLTVCTQEECFRQIMDCQDSLERMTGRRPLAIAYPYGRFNADVILSAQKAGLQLGFSCEEGKNRLPLNGMAFQIKRYDILGTLGQDEQCQRARSDVTLCWSIAKYLLHKIIEYRDMARAKKRIVEF